MAGNNSGSKSNSTSIAGISAARYLGNLAAELNQIGNVAVASNDQPGITSNVDWRARLRPKNGGRDLFWRGADASANAGTDYLLKPLFDAGGLVWQYTPDLLVSAQVNYNQTDFHGQNYPVMTYKNTIPPSIPITSDFTANTVHEARYLLAVQHFCKIATKSFGGDAAVANGFYGTPPPVLLFEYLGHHGFNKVPVVLTSYSMNLAADVDYVPVATGVSDESVTYVPTMCNFQINLQPTYTPHKLRKRFDLQSFTTGKNYKDGFI